MIVVFVAYRVFIPGCPARDVFYTAGGLSQLRAPTGLDETAFEIDGWFSQEHTKSSATGVTHNGTCLTY